MDKQVLVMPHELKKSQSGIEFYWNIWSIWANMRYMFLDTEKQTKLMKILALARKYITSQEKRNYNQSSSSHRAEKYTWKLPAPES